MGFGFYRDGISNDFEPSTEEIGATLSYKHHEAAKVQAICRYGISKNFLFFGNPSIVLQRAVSCSACVVSWRELSWRLQGGVLT